MITKRKIKKPQAEEKRALVTVDNAAMLTALRKSMIPSRFARPDVTLKAFQWGDRLGKWIDSSLMPHSFKFGGGIYITGEADQDLPVCAMTARTLVIRGHDALFITLAELMTTDEPPRDCEFLIVSGFYDDAFHKSKGMPMTAKEAYKLSWMLWRMANHGTTLVCYASPHRHHVANWWSEGALQSIFTLPETLTIKQ